MRARRAENPARMHEAGGNARPPVSDGGSAPLATVVSLPTARAARPGAQRRGTPTSAVDLLLYKNERRGATAAPLPHLPSTVPATPAASSEVVLDARDEHAAHGGRAGERAVLLVQHVVHQDVERGALHHRQAIAQV